eukprot:IDg12452t1
MSWIAYTCEFYGSCRYFYSAEYHLYQNSQRIPVLKIPALKIPALKIPALSISNVESRLELVMLFITGFPAIKISKVNTLVPADSSSANVGVRVHRNGGDIESQMVDVESGSDAEDESNRETHLCINIEPVGAPQQLSLLLAIDT